MRKEIKKEDIAWEIENYEMIYENSNFSRAVVELFCKNLNSEEIDILIAMIKKKQRFPCG